MAQNTKNDEYFWFHLDLVDVVPRGLCSLGQQLALLNLLANEHLEVVR